MTALGDGADHQSDKNLPLLSNTDDILVSHYIIHLECDFSNKLFNGVVILFTKPGTQYPGLQNDHSDCTRNSLILDCKDIDVIAVEEITLFTPSGDEEVMQNVPFGQNLAGKLLNSEGKALSFMQSEWCIKIWKEANTGTGSCHEELPGKVFRIKYQTSSKGESVTWAIDQDGRPCCFTQGAWINNRSLFPCQEPPVAMASWEAFVLAPKNAIVLMTGDNLPFITTVGSDQKASYFATNLQLPMSTVALVIGYLECVHIDLACIGIKDRPSVDGTAAMHIICRILAAPSIIHGAVTEFQHYLPCCLHSAQCLFGSYPFPRLDLVFLPRCFGALGLASPNLTLLSQSLICGDGSMAFKLAHEIAHAWFGLLIGAKDWTEEWLSEGFATYAEDQIHSHAMQWSNKAKMDFGELKDFIRFKNLSAEMENTDADLQTLRPNKGVEIRDGETNAILVKNGMNPAKSFAQVHYLKGYFLLRHLSCLVGTEAFNSLLKCYIEKYRGQLVHSQEIFKLFFSMFPHICSVTLESLYCDWLDHSGLPQDLKDFEISSTNELHNEVIYQLKYWNTYNKSLIARKRKCLEGKDSSNKFSLTSIQLVLLLEYLLDEKCLAHGTLQRIQQCYNLNTQSSDVRHRWCELIVRHNYLSAVNVIKSFLIEDQAMGVYLYGELLQSKYSQLRKLGIECYQLVCNELDAPAKLVVMQMMKEHAELLC